MYKISILSLLLCLGMYTQAQSNNFEWAYQFGGNGDESGTSVATDGAGNVYNTGYFNGRVDFAPGSDTFFMASKGSTDIFVTKTNTNGKLIWAVSIGGSQADIGADIAVDTSGIIYLTGSFQGTVDFNPGSSVFNLSSSGKSDIFVLKLNKNGNFIWAKKVGGPLEDAGTSVAISKTGYVHTTGYFSDTVSFTVGSSGKGLVISEGGFDIFVSRMDTSGKIVWLNRMGGPDDDAGKAIAVDASENAITTGYFNSKAGFNPSSPSSNILTSQGDAEVFISKLDGKGNYVWANPVSGNGYDIGLGIAVDASGLIYVTGGFSGNCDFNPSKPVASVVSNGQIDAFFACYQADGSYSWAYQIGSKGDDFGNSIIVDASSNVYLTGSFQNGPDFNPGTSNYTMNSVGSEDVFIGKYSSSAAFIWAYQMGGGKTDIGKDIAISSIKEVYTTGTMAFRGDFNPFKDSLMLVSNGGYDGFVQKMGVCKTTYGTVIGKSCLGYTYNGTTYNTTGTYYQTLKNAQGCDSVITIRVTINSPTFRNLDTIVCKSITINGQTYSSEGTYNQTLVNKLGCDSFLVINLKLGATARSINAIACNSYSINGKTYTSSGTYVQTLVNRYKCDSTLTIKLIIKKSSSSVLNITSCDSYNLAGSIYNQSGTYFKTIKNVADCDSNITLNLTINKSTVAVLNVDACTNYVLNGKTYDKSGTYYQKTKNVKGCDSAITLNLSINHSESTITQTACYSYTLNKTTYTQSGTYQQTVLNAKGCDSTITLNLTINKVDASASKSGAVLTANTSNASYQWLNCDKGYQVIPGQTFQSYLAKETGNYAVAVTLNSCTDTSECLNVNYNAVKDFRFSPFSIYPNPVDNDFTIQSGTRFDQILVSIYASDGRLVKHIDLRNFTMQIFNISDLSKGIYVVKVECDQGMFTSKITKL